MKKLSAICLILITSTYLFAQTEAAGELKPTPQLTQEQIEKHMADTWYTAIRPDYSSIDERVKNLAKNEKSPEDVAKVVCEGLETEIEKARAIFDWLCYNISYDTSFKIYYANDAFKARKGVCQGYAELFEVMADTVGLNNQIITGIGNGGTRGGHAWNVVYLKDGRPVLIDACWGAGYVNGSFFKREFKPAYFDPHPVVMAYNHLPENSYYQFFYPAITKEQFYKIPKLNADLYLPYGIRDPIDDYISRLKYSSDGIPPVSCTSSKYDSILEYEYISTGPELTDGFFIFNHEEMQKDFKNLFENEEYKRYIKGSSESDYSPVANMSLKMIAQFCNMRSDSFEKEHCFTIDDDGNVTFDFSKDGFRLPTKKEWLLALGSTKEYMNLSKADFARKVWFYDNQAGILHTVCERDATENKLYDMLGNVNELCWDEDTNQLVLMGGSISDTMETILSLEPVPYTNEIMDKTGYCGFRTVYSAPKNGKGQYEVAMNYKDGFLLECSQDLYKKWLDIAVKSDYATALFQKGFDYFCDDDNEQAFKYFLKSAEKNEPDSFYYLSLMYNLGLYVEQDNVKADEYTIHGSELNQKDCLYTLSHMYRDGDGIEQSDENYFLYLNKAMDNGKVTEKTEVELALCYQTGTGCEKNEMKAYNLLKAARKKYDSILSIINYADCFAEGLGTKQNWKTAFNEYKKAEEKGSLYAIKKLADCYYYGNGTDRNLDKAMECCSVLIDNNYQVEFAETKKVLCSSIKEAMEVFGKEGKAYFSSIPNGEDIGDYARLALELGTETKKLTGTALLNPALLQNLSLEEIKNKVLVPLNMLNAGEKLNGNLLIVLLPPHGSEWTKLEEKTFSAKMFSEKIYRVNGLNYKYDESLFEHYDSIIMIDRFDESADAMNEGLKKMTELTSECSQVDFITYSSDLFMDDSDYVNSFKQIVENQLEKGCRPRILAIGNKTDVLQETMNTIFSEEEISKINVFGTPANMKDQMACGFRNGNWFIVLLTEKINGKNLLIYLDETGWAPAPTRQDSTFTQSNQNLSKMTNIGYNKGGTITKTGKMVMHYKVVKESK